MPGEMPHMLVSVMNDDRTGENSRDADRRSALLNNCALILPETVDFRIISSRSALEWSVFRHSTAPYFPAFDRSTKRTLLSVSEAGKDRPPLQTAATLAGYALRLATFVPVDVVCWPYAQLVSDVDQLRTAMDSFSGGKDVPVLQFVRMTVRPDGTLTSTGLSYFCGQEIRLRAVGEMSAAGLVRRGCRIAADAMLNGPFEQQSELAGLAAGEQIRILPEATEHPGRKPQWLSIECDVRSAVLSGMDI